MPYVTHENDVQYLADDGSLLAEVTFPICGNDVVDINHTFVDESLRGQGIAGELLARAVSAISESGRRVRPTCAYAVRWFEKHPEHACLLAD